ncbi:MAG: hypothetical protein IH936_02325 [Acidobacteria bacterium]|nr:hypothetical protein [Acidobacteriota bacterium]
MLQQRRGKKQGKQPTQAQVLAELASDAELFHTPQGKAFATVRVNGHRETYPVMSTRFRLWLSHQFYRKEKRAPASQALKDAIATVQAQAIFDGVEIEVFLRVAGDDERIFLDLCNGNWEVVEIATDGWKIISDSPIKFRRAYGMLPLPHPRPGGSIDELRRFANVRTDNDFVLIVATLVAALNPSGPYPILNLIGEQGSAKSTLQRFLRDLVDPSVAPLRTAPRDERDLAIAANNAWMLVFDNLSGLSGTLSDALCRLATGGGFSTRKLYTDDEEALFDSQRPVMVNGINDSVLRGDLMDRAITVSLPAIPENRRLTEREIRAQFESVRPSILGGLLDAVSTGLRNLPGVKLERRPRMADFAEWVVACEPSLPWRGGLFLEAYAENRDTAVETALESDAVGVAIRALLEKDRIFTGPMSELLPALSDLVDEGLKQSKAWPKSARSLSNRVRRAAPSLRSSGIEFEEMPRESRRRMYRLEIVEGGAQEEGSSSDGRDATASGAAPTVTAESPTSTEICDGSDGSDGRIPTYSVGGGRRDGKPLPDDNEEEVAV